MPAPLSCQVSKFVQACRNTPDVVSFNRPVGALTADVEQQHLLSGTALLSLCRSECSGKPVGASPTATSTAIASAPPAAIASRCVTEALDNHIAGANAVRGPTREAGKDSDPPEPG